MCYSSRSRCLLYILVIAILMMVSGINVSADAVDSKAYIVENSAVMTNVCNTANKKIPSSVKGKILTYSGQTGILSFSNKTYAKLTVGEKREFMETSLMTVKKSNLGDKTKSRAYNFIASQDTSTSAAVKYLQSDANADFAKASKWFKPFGSVIGVVLGTISLFIFGFIALSIVFDLAYMCLPGWRVLVGRKSEDKRPKWVSREAYSSVLDSEKSISTDYKGYLGMYMRRRVPAIVLMSIALGYLVSGQLYEFIGWCIDSFSWIFDGVFNS